MAELGPHKRWGRLGELEYQSMWAGRLGRLAIYSRLVDIVCWTKEAGKKVLFETA